MKSIPLTSETAALANRVLWFEDAPQALSMTPRFMAYAFRYANPDEMQVIRKHLSDDDLREALRLAPPGIIDARSWSYWHLMLDCYPPPPLPQRKIAD